MNLLLDTHIFLWFVNDNSQLSDQLKSLIEDENNSIYLSLARANASKINKTKWTKKVTYVCDAKIRFIANLIFLSVHER